MEVGQGQICADSHYMSYDNRSHAGLLGEIDFVFHVIKFVSGHQRT